MGQHRVDIPIGSVFGRLTVLRPERVSGRHGLKWVCRCNCGKRSTVSSLNLRNGMTTSCGCWMREEARARGRLRITHGHRRTGRPSRTYRSWSAMRQRCHDANSPAFLDYGARGISVCLAWRQSFDAFLNDMGLRPKDKCLDRIDPRYGYFAANCRWATRKQQCANRRRPTHSRYPTADLARAEHALSATLRTAQTNVGRSVRRQQRSTRGRPRTTHGHKSGALRAHGGSRTYRSWRAMMQRCHDANSPAFLSYGAKGISVCRAWRENFVAFLNDMGERPEAMTLDRIDPRFGYFAPNCQWATPKQQIANRRLDHSPPCPMIDLVRAQLAISRSAGRLES